MVGVDDAGQRLLTAVHRLNAAAVTQILCCVSKAVVVSIMQQIAIVCSRKHSPVWLAGQRAAWTAS